MSVAALSSEETSAALVAAAAVGGTAVAWPRRGWRRRGCRRAGGRRSYGWCAAGPGRARASPCRYQWRLRCSRRAPRRGEWRREPRPRPGTTTSWTGPCPPPVSAARPARSYRPRRRRQPGTGRRLWAAAAAAPAFVRPSPTAQQRVRRAWGWCRPRVGPPGRCRRSRPGRRPRPAGLRLMVPPRRPLPKRRRSALAGRPQRCGWRAPRRGPHVWRLKQRRKQ